VNGKKTMAMTQIYRVQCHGSESWGIFIKRLYCFHRLKKHWLWKQKNELEQNMVST